MENKKAARFNEWRYVTEPNGITVREVSFDTARGGEPITVLHLTDLHFNYCNQQDIDEADPVLMSTLANRKWLANGASVPAVQKLLQYGKDAEQIVITGDIFDYLSHGCIELAKTHLFEPCGDRLMASLGNHEAVRKMQGVVDDPTTFESRLAILQENWCNDIYYSSKVLGDKVMLIQMDDSTQFDTTGRSFWNCQIDPLERDLARARENQWIVLLFFHNKLSTGNPADKLLRSSMVGDKNTEYCDFYNYYARSDSEGASGVIYNMIVNSADVIKGCFCGHHHSDFYTEILAKTPDGRETVIPQYCMMASIYGQGHALKITVH